MGCHNLALVNASADHVWRTLRNFHDLSWSANVVESVTPVGDAGGTDLGAKRILNGAFHETLHALDDGAHYLKYSIDDGPGPVARDQVSGYFGEIRVMEVTVPAGGPRAAVMWTSHWARENGGVQEFCDPIYKALLNDLVAHFT